MKTKRWKRRNRHARPEWVEAWRNAEVYSQYYKCWHFPVFISNNVSVLDYEHLHWLTAMGKHC